MSIIVAMMPENVKSKVRHRNRASLVNPGNLHFRENWLHFVAGSSKKVLVSSEIRFA